MRRPLYSSILLVAALWCGASLASSSPRITHRLNADWKFVQEDVIGADATAFDDTAWQDIGLPHTFNHADALDEMPKQASLGLRDTGTYYWSGATWYRKHFALPASLTSRVVYVEFEGVSQRADVWINGYFLGTHFGHAVPFVFELTDHLACNAATNVLAVRVDNSNEACFAVPGAMFWTSDRFGGIIRDVWLHVVDRVHIPINVYTFQQTWGTYVAATNVIPGERAEVVIRTRVQNRHATARACTLTTRIEDAGGDTVWQADAAITIPPRFEHEFEQHATVARPHLWDVEDPYLYAVRSRVDSGGETNDTFVTPLGIYTYSFHHETGFRLNGRDLKLRGFGIRQTAYGGLLTAVSDYLHDKDVRLLREANGIFIRQGHCAADPAILRACDRYGVLIAAASAEVEVGWNSRKTDEPALWWQRKKEFTRDIIVRDRNHPSVLLWEFANGTMSTNEALELTAIVDEWDDLSSRPTTAAANSVTKVPRAVIDVIGGHGRASLEWAEGFDKPMMMMEYGWTKRFGYRDDWPAMIKKAVVTLCDFAQHFESAPQWAGMVLWTLHENTGESHDSDGIASKFGALDLNGRIPKEIYHALKTAYAPEPSVRILGHWNHVTNTAQFVTIVASRHVADVQLLLNDEAVRKGTLTNHCATLPFVMWEPGTLKVIARDRAGTPVAEHVIETTGPPAAIQLACDPAIIEAGGGDCAVITATVVDDHGRWCPTASNLLTFACEGPVDYRGGFNHHREHTHGSSELNAEAGKMAVTIRSRRAAGTMTVRASAAGLLPGEVTIESVRRTNPLARPATPR